MTVDARITAQVPTARGFVASVDVFDLDGRQIGTEVLSCLVPKPRELRCDFAVAFADGLVRGTFVSPAGGSRISGVIDGGTREYAGATGTVAGRATADNTGARVTLRIKLPKQPAATTPQRPHKEIGRAVTLLTVDAEITSQVVTEQGFVAGAAVSSEDGEQIGTEVLSCVFGEQFDQCDFTVAFADGLVYGNFVSPAGSSQIIGVITGGTRAYEGATGAVAGSANEQRTGATVTLLIQSPKR